MSDSVMKQLISGLLLCLLAARVLAASQDIAALETIAGQFLQQELSQRQASFKLGHLDRHLVLPQCSRPKVDWSDPAMTTGNTAVLIACLDGGWSLRLPVVVTEKHMGVVLTRAVSVGEVLQPSDVSLAEITNPGMARNVLTDLNQAIGMTMRSSLPVGGWLRSFMVRPPYVVHAGQAVKVIAGGEGFNVESEGIANSNAAVGDSISVRMPTGRVVRGQVQVDGSINLGF